MTQERQASTADDSLLQLSRWLATLSDPATLALLSALSTPKPRSNLQAALGMNERELERRLAPLLDERFVVEEEGLLRAQPARLFALHERLLSVAAPPAKATGEEGRTTLLPRLPSDIGPRPGQPRVVVVNGPHLGTELRLAPGKRLRVGRDEACELVLDFDPYVSGVHAEFYLRDQHVELVDHFSLNGTYVNWVRLAGGATQRLGPGDVVGFGRTLVVLQA